MIAVNSQNHIKIPTWLGDDDNSQEHDCCCRLHSQKQTKSTLEFIFNSVIFSDSLTAGAATQQAARASFIMQGHSVDFYSVFIV